MELYLFHVLSYTLYMQIRKPDKWPLRDHMMQIFARDYSAVLICH